MRDADNGLMGLTTQLAVTVTCIVTMTSAAATDVTPWVYPVTSYRVVDGDSIHTQLDLGWGLTLGQSARVVGVDAPEMAGAHKPAGTVVRQLVVDWCSRHEPLYAQLIEPDKYGDRYVGRVFGAKGEDLTTYLLRCKLAKPYDGSKKIQWTPAELQAIENLQEQQ